ncbi:CYFA0S08e02564g1_1 [Cyberlindnera fabianii]|uniref:CYFA0S08e02564g1_1 n=1 Tax=Cyberlindnera fabianii TaxID=36022 RepID=A0A061AWW6_CYBFA|nr:CYFA0S08e02564g1_1 [Cyberlindnera fabianii]
MSNRIFFVSLISRDNRPLHIQEIEPLRGQEVLLSDRVDAETGLKPEKPLPLEVDINEHLKYHFLSNMALDVFLSPLYTGEPGIPTLMFVQDGVCVYGYETNTGLKILVGTSEEIDHSFEYIFKSMHKIYLGLVVNPFQSNDTNELTINEKSMEVKIKNVIKTWRAKYASTQEERK